MWLTILRRLAALPFLFVALAFAIMARATMFAALGMIQIAGWVGGWNAEEKLAQAKARRRPRGQALAEYAIVLALFAMLALGGLMIVRGGIKAVLSQVDSPIKGTVHGPIVKGALCDTARAAGKRPARWGHPHPNRPAIWTCDDFSYLNPW